MSRSPTTTEDVWSDDPADWLPNAQAGDIVLREFMAPAGLSTAAMAEAIGVAERRIADLIAGRSIVDAELDLRLARYFGMSNGFFLGLQIEHDILEQRRAIGAELDRIVPRAA